MTELLDDSLPQESICYHCDQVQLDVPGIAQYLADRRLYYYDEQQGKMVNRGGVKFCRCDEPPKRRRRP